MLQMKNLTVDGVTYAVTDETKLPLPETAAVGQFLKVTEVDENGQVTKVETAQVPGLTKTLLWENAAPASTFAAQRIVGAFGYYDEVEIEYLVVRKNAQLCRIRETCKVGEGQVVQSQNFTLTTAANLFREALVYAEYIQFQDCLTHANVVANIHLIPSRIYGIKGVNNE